MSKERMWELYPKYAEQPMVIIIAASREIAEKQAAFLAKKGIVSAGYGPNGALCPMEVT